MNMTLPFGSAATWSAPEPGRSRVLVAEDDFEMRRLIAATLRREHYDVTEAANGVQLLDCLEAAATHGWRFAAIVSDVRMPLLSGMDVLAILRAAAEEVPVILITAFGDGDTHAEAHELGAVGILDKPFDMTALTVLLARAIQGM